MIEVGPDEVLLLTANADRRSLLVQNFDPSWLLVYFERGHPHGCHDLMLRQYQSLEQRTPDPVWCGEVFAKRIDATGGCGAVEFSW